MLDSILKLLGHPRWRKYTTLVREDLIATYSRDLHKWLIIAPIVGVAVGLVTAGIAAIVLYKMWPPLLNYFIHHHWAIIPTLVVGFLITGLIMQFFAPDPDEHSTEEIIKSYHERQGSIGMRSFFPKIIAAIITVGCGGSAALEGPGIYGGGAIGSWLWEKLRRIGLQPRDRRIMLISGAAAGMAAVFRAPLTGLVFALEVPYKDDLAHEALVPSLIASVVSYFTLASFMGAGPIFDFTGGTSYTRTDLLWSALLGVICGLIAMLFDITFRRARNFVVKTPVPHWVKLTVGGLLTGVCGLAFVMIFKGSLIPIGPNYEAVGKILLGQHTTIELAMFGVFKLAATIFSLGSGGVSAMFVPLFLTGASFGTVFNQALVHSPSPDLYAAVGMAAFIAGGYKTPLAAVVFVAEATGGHAFVVPTLIGAAIAYVISGEASVSTEQRLHESVKIQQLDHIMVQEIMQKNVVSVQAESSLKEFAESITAHHLHSVFPVYNDRQLLGTISVWALAKLDPRKWSEVRVGDFVQKGSKRIPPTCDLMEALRLLMGDVGEQMLLVTNSAGKLEGIVTKTDILAALRVEGERRASAQDQTATPTPGIWRTEEEVNA
ncbi:MAG TPA: chloride channel protein [Terriglobia bacterium]|nr:chloride channel protein [Terriglobia bacterium]